MFCLTALVRANRLVGDSVQGSTVALMCLFILKQCLFFVTKCSVFFLVFSCFNLSTLVLYVALERLDLCGYFMCAHVKGEGEETECSVKQANRKTLNSKEGIWYSIFLCSPFFTHKPIYICPCYLEISPLPECLEWWIWIEVTVPSMFSPVPWHYQNSSHTLHTSWGKELTFAEYLQFWGW